MIAISSLIGLIAAAGGHNCESPFAKWLLWSVSAAALIVAVAFVFVYFLMPHLTILHLCSGNFLTGMFCPSEVTNSLSYSVASRTFSIWFYGTFVVIIGGSLMGLMALLIEIITRYGKRQNSD